MANSIYFSTPNLMQYKMRFSNPFISIVIENMTNLEVQSPYQVKAQRSEQEGIVLEYKIGMNAGVIVIVTVECPSQFITDLGCAFDDWMRDNEPDTKGTLEIVNPDGTIMTYNDAILQENPLNRSVSSTAENPTYILTFSASIGERG